MNDLLYDSFGSSDIVDPLLEDEEERKKLEDVGLLTPAKQQLDLDPNPPKTSDFSEPGNYLDDIQAGMLEVRQEREDAQLDASMNMGLQENIEALSKNDRAVKELELPLEVIESDPEGAARQLKIKQAKDLLELTPKAKAILADIEKSRGLTDSVEELTFWEVLAQDAEHGFTQGNRLAALSRLGLEAKRTDDPAKRKQYFEEIRSIQAAMAAAPKTEFFLGGHGIVGSAAEQAIVMRELFKEAIPHALYGAGVGGARGAFAGTPGGPAGVLTGLGIGAGVGFGVGTYKFASEFEEGGSYIELIQEGVDPQAAYHISTGVGVINGLLEVGAFGVLAKPIKDALVKTFVKDSVRSLTDKTVLQAFKAGGKAYLTVMLKEMGIELAQETTTMAGTEIGRVLSGKEAKILSEEGRGEMAAQYLEILDKTFKTMILFAAPGGLITTAAELRDVKKSNQAELFMTAIGDSEQASEATEKLPARKQAAVAEIIKDGPLETVYINANGLQEVFQEGTEAVAEELGVADQLEENLGEIDGYLEVPTGVYATKIARDQKNHDALKKYTKFSVDDKTSAEMEHHVAEEVVKVEKVLEASEDRAALEESGDLVYNKVKADLEKSGRWTKESIEQNATLHRAWAITKGQNLGMTPQEVYEEYGPTATEDVVNPLEISQEDWDARRVPNAEQLAAEGYDAIRVGERTYKLKTIQRAEERVRTETLDQAAEAVKAEPGFDSFIEGSQVVDAAGEPLVVYHGTQAGEDFGFFETETAFDLGTHFGTIEQANDRLGTLSTWRREEPLSRIKSAVGMDVKADRDSRIIPVYLSIKNPLRMNDAGDFSDPALFLEAIQEAAVPYEAYKAIKDIVDEGENIAAVKNKIEELGYDGIVYQNQAEGQGDSYIAFHPEQIKSIHAKKFDPTSPDILAQEGENLWNYFYEENKGEFWRGESKEGAGVGLGALGSGIYITDRKGIADFFASQHPSGVVSKYKVKPGLKLINSWDQEVVKIKEEMGFKSWEYSDEPLYANTLTSRLKELGYDGVVSDKPAEGIVIFDKKNVELIEGGESLYQSAAPLQKKPLKIEGTGKKGQITNWDIAGAFTKRHDEKYGRKLDPQNNKEDYKIVLRELNKEYKNQATEQDAGADWYIANLNEAVEITKLIIPELSDPIKKDIFLAIVAFTSPNNAPVNNWEVAVQVMQGYIKNGKIPTKRINPKTGKWTGKNLGVPALRTGTQLLQHLISTLGEAGALEWISTTKGGKEIAQMRKESGLYAPGRPLGKYLPTEMNLSETYSGAHAMGPKVGEFFLNVAGLNQNAVTIDLWAARTYNRMIGRLLDVSPAKVEDKTIVQDVRGKVERDIIKRLFRDLAKKNNIDPSAMQAALWYFEQRLFKNHGATARSENFAGGARSAAKERGIAAPGPSEDAQRALQAEGVDLQELYQTIEEEAAGEEVVEEIKPTWYYSVLAEAVHTLKPSKAQPKTGDEWINTISKLPKVKKEEIVWTGLDNFLSMDHEANAIVAAEENLAFLKVKSFRAGLEGYEKLKPRQQAIMEKYKKMISVAAEDLELLRKQKPRRFTHQEIKDYLAKGGVRVIDVINGENMDFELRAYQAEVEVRASDLEEEMVNQAMFGTTQSIHGDMPDENFEMYRAYHIGIASPPGQPSDNNAWDNFLMGWATTALGGTVSQGPRRFTAIQRKVLEEARADMFRDLGRMNAAMKKEILDRRVKNTKITRRVAEEQYAKLTLAEWFGDLKSANNILAGNKESGDIGIIPKPFTTNIYDERVESSSVEEVVDRILREVSFRMQVDNKMADTRDLLFENGAYWDEAIAQAKDEVRTQHAGDIGTRHGKWTLDSENNEPGGTNYTELLLTYPDMRERLGVVPERAKSIRNKLNKWADETSKIYGFATALELQRTDISNERAAEIRETRTKGYWRYQLANTVAPADIYISKGDKFQTFRKAMERAMRRNEAPWDTQYDDSPTPVSTLFDALTEEEWAYYSENFQAYFNARAYSDPTQQWVTFEMQDYVVENHFKAPNIIIWLRMTERVGKKYDIAESELDIADQKEIDTMAARRQEIMAKISAIKDQQQNLEDKELLEELDPQGQADLIQAQRWQRVQELKQEELEVGRADMTTEERSFLSTHYNMKRPPEKQLKQAAEEPMSEGKRLRVERSRLANENIALRDKEHKLDRKISKRRGAGPSKVLLIEESQGDLAKAWRDYRKRQYILKKEKQQIKLGKLTKKERDWMGLGRGKSRPEQRLPFIDDTKATQSLALKRAISYGLENGYDRIEWTTGLQQSARYDKSDYLSGLIWNPDTKALKIRQKGESAFTEVATVELEELHKYIGDDSTIKLLAAPLPDLKIGEEVKKIQEKMVEVVAEKTAQKAKLKKFVASENKLVGFSTPGEHPDWVSSKRMGARNKYLKLLERYGLDMNVAIDMERRLPQAKKELKKYQAQAEGMELDQPEGPYPYNEVVTKIGELKVEILDAESGIARDQAEASRLALENFVHDFQNERKLESIDTSTRFGKKVMKIWKTEGKVAVYTFLTKPAIKNIDKRATKYFNMLSKAQGIDRKYDAFVNQKKMLIEKDTGAVPGIQPNEKALVGLDLEMSNEEQSDFYDKILPSVAKKTLQSVGVKNPAIDTAGRAERKSYTEGKQPGFNLDQVRQILIDEEGKTKKLALFQKARKEKLGAYDLDRRVITLLEDANLSSFLHETGHFFFEATRHLANRPDAPQQIKDDMDALLKFIGVSDLTTWNNMGLEERRPGHEQVAKAFELYLFEGKSPVPELMEMFRRFRQWLIAVYENLVKKKLDVTLTDDVRGVFDRMLATKEEIEAGQQINGLDPMFTTQPDTMDNATWKAYLATIRQAHDESEEQLEARILRNLRWESGAKGRILRQMQREENARREGVRLESTQVIAEEPVHKVKAFLRQPVEKKKKAKWNPKIVDPKNDSLFTAIAKLGGLIKTEVVKHWGIDKEEVIPSGLGVGRPVLRATGGLTMDRMAEALAEIGYLPVDENGKYDLHDLEDRFLDEKSGNKRYSTQNDEYDFSEDYENFVATEEGLQPLDESVINGKLSIPIMEELYGIGEDAFWRQLPTGRYGLATIQEDGLHPDTVAKKFGFSSGDEMIRALIDAPSLREAVKAETDRRMLELYGDMNAPEQREQAVNKALYNEATTRRVHAELSALSKGMGPGNLLVQEAKAWAEEKISRMTPRKLRPSQYFANERRYNKQAERALAKGNRKEAMEAKRAAVMNYHFARAAMKALEEVDRDIRYFKKFDSKGVQKKVAREQLDQIFAALEKYDLRKSVTRKEIERREDLHEWVKQQEELGLTPSIDPRLLTGKYAPLKHYRDIPMEELRGLYDSIRSIEHLGRLKNRLLVAREQRNRQQAVDEMVASIEATSPKGAKYKGVIETSTKGERRNAFWRGIAAAHRKLSSFIRQFDGFEAGGPAYNYIIRPLDERTEWENEEKAKSTMRLIKIWGRYSAKEQRHNAGTKIYIPALGTSLTKAGMIAVALNWGNATNRQRLMGEEEKGGYGWNSNQIAGEGGILDHLDQRDWDFVQEIWDYFEEFWPEIEAKEKRISGVAPEKVEAMPVETKFGMYRGGYYPIKYNRELDQDAFKHFADEIAEDMKMGAYARAMTKHGFTKERVKGNVNSPVRLDLGVIFEHINEVIHDLAFHEVLVDMGQYLNHPKFRKAINNHYSNQVLTNIQEIMRDIAVGYIPATWEGDRFIQHVQSGTTIAGIALNMGTVVLQPMGLTQGMKLIGIRWVFQGMARFFYGGHGMERGIKWIHGKSIMMKNRGEHLNREIDEVKNKVQREHMVEGISGPIGETYFYMIVKAQMLADVPIWLGMYEKIMERGVKGKEVDEATAIAMADRAVKESQASGNMMDLAKVQRGAPTWKLFSTFYSFFSASYQLMHESWVKTKITHPLSIGRLAVDYLLIVALPVAMETIVRGVMLRGECDGGDDMECVGQKLIQNQAAYMIGMYMGLRELSGVFQGFHGYDGPAGSRIFAEAGKLLKQVQQMELDRALARSLNQVGGILLHWPATFNQRIIDAFWDASEGKEVRPTAPLFGQARR